MPFVPIFGLIGEHLQGVKDAGVRDVMNLTVTSTARDLLTPGALSELTADSWSEILTFAARAAAVTCSRAGAEPPYGREVEEFASR